MIMIIKLIKQHLNNLKLNFSMGLAVLDKLKASLRAIFNCIQALENHKILSIKAKTY